MLVRDICKIQKVWGSEKTKFLKQGVVESDTLRGSPKELMLGAMKMKPKFPKKLHNVGYSRDMGHLPVEAAGTQ